MGWADGQPRVPSSFLPAWWPSEPGIVGDVINLAARLEKNCMTDGVLLSHTNRLALLRSDPELLDKLDLEKRVLSPDEMKGQNLDIRAWQLPPAAPRSGRGAARFGQPNG